MMYGNSFLFFLILHEDEGMYMTGEMIRWKEVGLKLISNILRRIFLT